MLAGVVLALLAAACTTQEPPERTPLPSITAPTTTLSELEASDRSLLTDTPGRLLVLGPDNEIWTMRPDGSDLIVLADHDPELRRRTVPTWSPDASKIAWTDERQDYTGTLHVVDSAGTELLAMPTPMVAEYIAWAPDGTSFALMGNDDFGEFRLAVVGLDGSFVELATGAPMSIDWSPDGSALLVRIVDQAEIIGISHPDTRTPVPVGTATRLAAYVGDAILTTGADEPGHLLRLIGADDTATDLLRFGHPAAYVVDPAQGRIAIVGRSSADALAVADHAAAEPADPIPSLRWDRLTVVDLTDGDLRQVDDRHAVSFSWNPDGSALHWTTFAGDGTGALQWHVVVGEGDPIDYPPFVPGGDYARSYLAFFDQFERAVSLWSPDGQAWAYAGGQSGGTSTIWVQMIDQAEPIAVVKGGYVTWSPQA